MYQVIVPAAQAVRASPSTIKVSSRVWKNLTSVTARGRKVARERRVARIRERALRMRMRRLFFASEEERRALGGVCGGGVGCWDGGVGWCGGCGCLGDGFERVGVGGLLGVVWGAIGGRLWVLVLLLVVVLRTSVAVVRHSC